MTKPSSTAALSGPILPYVLGSAVPIWLSVSVDIVLSIVALGQFALLDPSFLPALGYVGPVIGLAHAFAFASADATATLTARWYGRRNPRQASRLVLVAVVVSVALATLISAPLLILQEPLARQLAVSPDLQIVFAIFLAFTVADAILRTLLGSLLGALRGLSKFRLVSVVNVAIPALQIIVLQIVLMMQAELDWSLSVKALVAMAAGTAPVCLAILAALVLWWRAHGQAEASKDEPEQDLLTSFREALCTILSYLVVSIMTPLVMFTLGFSIVSQGESAAAAFGVISRIQPLFFAFGIGVSSVAATFFSANVGVGNLDRAKEGYFRLCTALIGIHAGLAILGNALWPVLNPVFQLDYAASRLIFVYLVIVPASFGFLAITTLSVRLFNAFDHGFQSVKASALRVGATVLFILAGEHLWRFHGAMVGFSLANFAAGASFFLISRRALADGAAIPNAR